MPICSYECFAIDGFFVAVPKITLYYWTKEDLGAIPVFHKAIAIFWAHLMSLPVLEILTKISLKTLYKYHLLTFSAITSVPALSWTMLFK